MCFNPERKSIKMSKYSLLYIEDEIYIRTMVVEYLQQHFETIYQASTGKEA
jgi:CheY-like chemotaxis protein